MAHLRPWLSGAAIAGLLLASTAIAQAEGVLHRGNGTEPETLDPHKASGVPEHFLLSDILEGLVADDAKGEPIPGVAESWDISDDGLTYTFHLRPDAVWSNGEPLTAEDFVYSWRRGLDPATAADYAFILWPIQNAEQITKGELPVDQLSARAVDAHTLEVTLKAPTPYFLQMLTHYMSWPVYRPGVEAYGDQFTRPENFVGNGAFTLTEWVPQGQVTLTKNPLFHDAANVSLDQVIYYPTEDVENELQRFRSGELDITYDVPSQQIPMIESEMADVFHNTVYLGTYYYAVNVTREQFSDVRVREALALAIDRDVLTERITQAGEIPAYGWVPPGTYNYEPATLPWATETQQERNEQAKALLAEAGYGPDNPLTLEILYNTNDNHKVIAIAVAAMWKQALGVNASIRNEEWGTYLNSRDELQFDVVRAGWIGDYNDAYTFAELLRGDIGQMNPAGWENAEYDALVAEATTTSDMDHRRELLEQAEAVALAELPVIPIYFYTQQHLISPRVSGWEDNIMDRHPSRFLSVTPAS